MTPRGRGATEAADDSERELLEALTREEKVAMAAGSSLWFSTPVARLGVPAFEMSEGRTACAARAPCRG